MASTERLPSGKYRGVYRDAAQKKKYTPARERKQDAREDAVEAEAKARRRAAADAGTLSARTTYRQWIDTWWSDREIELSTEASEAAVRDRDLLPYWGDYPLNRISRGEVQRWVNKLSGPRDDEDAPRRSAGYVLRIYGVFRNSIAAAVDEEVLTASPLTRIKLPTLGIGPKRHFEQDEIDAVLPKLRKRHREAVELQMETGLRPGELAGLHWSKTSLSTGWITVADTLMRGTNTIKSVPKDEDAREVPLTSRAVEILTTWREEIPPGNGCGLQHTNGRRCTSDLVLRQLNGSPLSLTSYRDVFARALQRAGVRPGSPYDLRHTFASRLAEAGVDPFEIARLLGHATLTQSMTYVHRTAAARRRFLVAMGDPAAQGLAVVGRGTDRGTDRPSQALPDAPTDDERHAV